MLLNGDIQSTLASLKFSFITVAWSHPPHDYIWHVCGNPIMVVDVAKHLGILLSTSHSTVQRTTNFITSSRSAYYALSAVGARHTGINPCTSLLLYKAVSLSRLTFGLDVWSPTASEVLMMERSQLKILRTILGLPNHVPTDGIHMLLGTIPIKYIAIQKQLTFVRNTIALPEYAIARRILLYRCGSPDPPPSSIVRSFSSSLENLCLPSILELANDLPSKLAWKALIKSLIHEQFRDVVASNQGSTLSLIMQLPLPRLYGESSQVLRSFRSNLSLARLSNLRVRLLLHATTLSAHTSRFRDQEGRDRSPLCRLCPLDQPEDPLHLITSCPTLLKIRVMWLPKIYGNSVPPPLTIFNHVMGIEWFDHQELLLRFLADLYAYRSIISQL